MRRALLVVVILCAALLAPAAFASSATAGQAPAISGIVRYVIDGDTLLLQPDGGGKPIKLRLLGIDAPEICQAGGQASRDALAGRVVGRRVLATGAISDDYRRRLVTLTHDSEDIGAWMVLQGQAWNARYRGRPGPYASEELAARAARRGVYAELDPQSPRSFRRTHGSCYPAHAR